MGATVIRGGTVVDGTGAPGRRADVALEGGPRGDVERILEVVGDELDELLAAEGFGVDHRR